MSRPPDAGASQLRTILGIPLAIFAATLFGLATALLGSEAWHWLAWLLLAVPPVVIVIALIKKSAMT